MRRAKTASGIPKNKRCGRVIEKEEKEDYNSVLEL